MSMQEDWPEAQPKKRGMSGGMKLLLILGGIGGFFMLLCCGGFAFIGWKASNLMTTDPETVKARTQDIATIEVLPGFKPAQAMDMVFMKWVLYQGEQGNDSMLMLMAFNGTMMPQGDQKQLRDQMLEQMRQQEMQKGGAGANTNVQADESETRNFKIGGRNNEFLFVKGKQNGKPVRQVTGTFPTADGVAMLMLIVPEEKYDEAAVVRMLESIRTPETAAAENEAEEMEAEDSSQAPGSTIHLDQPDQSGKATPDENDEAEESQAEPNS